MRVAILTSGGDTPGMNAVIRAIYLRAKVLGHEIIGIKDGWKGLIQGTIVEIPEEIENWIDKGGTILGSSRVNPYTKETGVIEIKNTIKSHRIDGIIAIGGEDTLGVAKKLYDENIKVIGVPKTIDNDLDATDYTFGFNTAYSIATEALDRAKTTAQSHERVLVIEIMGRNAGWLTLYAGIAGGAHAILIPEMKITPTELIKLVQRRYKRKRWAVIAIAEGFGFDEVRSSEKKDEFGHIRLEKQETGKKIAKLLTNSLGYPTRSITLGHIQRGGTPSAYDRVLCTRLGIKAIEMIHNKKFGIMVSLRGTSIISTTLEQAIAKLKIVDEEHLQILKQLRLV